MDNLPELRDIHLPSDGISIFPLASGWWLCLLAIILLFFGGKMYYAARRASAKFYAKYVITHQAKDNDLYSVIKMSEIMRRICVSQYPQAVSLSGDDWIYFLEEKCKFKLSEEAEKLFKVAPYVRAEEIKYSPEDIESLREFCLQWVGENL